MDDGIAFVNACVASAAPETASETESLTSASPNDESRATSSSPPADQVVAPASGRGLESSSDSGRKTAGVGWDEAFGPPYTAIFVDVDSKDKSVGMSCPPAAFVEATFLNNLKSLLRGVPPGKAVDRGGPSGNGEGQGQGQGQGLGVLAINIAARSKGLYDGAVKAVSDVFAGGEVGIFC